MPATKEWTLMFYFASDNPLAPSTVSQLKAIKQAGFRHDVNVIAHFDPHVKDTPTHIFDVNLTNKLKAPGKDNIGFRGNDPFVRSLVCDRLWTAKDKRIRAVISEFINRRRSGKKRIRYNPPLPPSTMSTGKNPKKDLAGFLRFCRTKYPARHYALFILGHGLVVGNDLFLFDEDADIQSLGLTDLGRTLRNFKNSLSKRQRFDLLSFHSCSMSSMEVAYELTGIADYMLASQGPTFVGSWPYRQILVGMFNDLKKKEKNFKKTLTSIFSFCVNNSYDFQLAGYPFDLCLTDLNKVRDIRGPMARLSKALIVGLDEKETDSTATGLILLAHWEAQSYWQESYTDLYDFCFCLEYNCANNVGASGTTQDILNAIQNACGEVMDVLKRGTSRNDDRLILHSDFVGPAFQYTHGLSVFFPWSMTTKEGFWNDYSEKYKFSSTHWHEFLKKYFETTQRFPHVDEEDVRNRSSRRMPFERELLEEISTLVFDGPGSLGTVKNGSTDAQGGGKVGSTEAGGPDDGIKSGSTDAGGSDGAYSSIKNYPSTTRSKSKTS